MKPHSVSIEFFFAGGCSACAQVRQALRETVESIGHVTWEEIDIAKNPHRAVDVGVMSTPAIAIDGSLVFKIAPAPAELRQAIETSIGKT